MSSSPCDPTVPTSRLWYRPRHLPLFDAATVTQAITYRLSDSLPRHIVERLAEELAPEAGPRYRARIETYLDTGHGSGCLIDPVITTDIIDTWHRFAGDRYLLHAWCVMPNHVHVLMTPLPGYPLGAIIQSWKSRTGKRIRRRNGLVAWQRDYWDRYIRDEFHYHQMVAYIHENPVKAGLVPNAVAWPWSSAGCRGVP